MAHGVLVACDSPDDRRRRKVAGALARLGRRVQYSVFLLQGRSGARVAEVLEPLLDVAEDDVRIHPLCASCARSVRLMGKARRPKLPEGVRVV